MADAILADDTQTVDLLRSRTDCRQAAFADRLRELMTTKCVTQQELSNRIGCSQPAISQMLNRKCRPQKNTIFKLAEALQVQPRELWPDLEVADMLDAVAGFQKEDRVMTEAEAKALRDTKSRNASKGFVSRNQRQHLRQNEDRLARQLRRPRL